MTRTSPAPCLFFPVLAQVPCRGHPVPPVAGRRSCACPLPQLRVTCNQTWSVRAAKCGVYRKFLQIGGDFSRTCAVLSHGCRPRLRLRVSTAWGNSVSQDLLAWRTPCPEGRMRGRSAAAIAHGLAWVDFLGATATVNLAPRQSGSACSEPWTAPPLFRHCGKNLDFRISEWAKVSPLPAVIPHRETPCSSAGPPAHLNIAPLESRRSPPRFPICRRNP